MTLPLTPSDIAAIDKDSVVRAVAWREDKARETAAHAHGAGQLIGSLSGLLSVQTLADWWVLPATHAIWVPPHTSHAVRSHGAFQGWSIYIAEDLCKQMPPRPQVVRTSALLTEITTRVMAWDTLQRTPAQGRLAQVMIDEIAELPPERLGLPRPSDGRLCSIADAMLENIDDTRSVGDWARWAGLSERTLARRFQQETGLTIGVWRQRAKALRAIALLADGDAVTTVAMDLGYENVSAFIAMFRRVMGASPGHYQRSSLNK